MMLGKKLFGNCDIRLCLGAADTLTAQYFSDLLGIATTETQSLKKDAGFEGNFEYGQKNISTLKRNLLNADEILRIPHNKLLVNIRGNKPLLLDKMIYTKHELAHKLKDISVNDYCPIWNTKKIIIETEKNIVNDNNISNNELTKDNEKIIYEDMTFDNF